MKSKEWLYIIFMGLLTTTAVSFWITFIICPMVQFAQELQKGMFN